MFNTLMVFFLLSFMIKLMKPFFVVDRIGIKPLYYFLIIKLIVCSEIKGYMRLYQPINYDKLKTYSKTSFYDL